MLAVALACAVLLPAGARAEFGIADFDLTFTGPGGSPATQAGSHPFAVTLSLTANTSGGEPDGRLRDLFFEGPPGLVGSALATPGCTRAAFLEIKEGVNGCPTATAVGISSSSFDEPGKSSNAPIFNLTPSPGVLASLGFRVADAASVVVDIGPSPYPPYGPIAELRDVPETVALFGAELQLWGTPADPAHDAQRGICGTTAAADLCPVFVEQRPMLTLPTSCDGPLESFYEAFSWEGNEDFASSFAPGLTGCGKLAFGPSMKVQPTTEAAKTPTGLDFSLDVVDPGIENPGGIAQSQIRDVDLVLPEGMAANPALFSQAGGCSEADLENENLSGAPGEGCPDSSKIGAVEVESPLVFGPIKGSIYRAIPFQNFAGDSPVALYAVLKDLELGVLITQVAGSELDPESGRLIFFAEDLPQLPFSHLRLHLQEGDGAPLISSPFCGDYETEVEMNRWSDVGAYLISSNSSIVSGPGGGPCPTGGDSQPQGACVSCPNPPPSSQLPAPSSGSAPIVRRRCPKAKRRVRRNGKVHCVKRHRRHARHRHGAGRLSG